MLPPGFNAKGLFKPLYSVAIRAPLNRGQPLQIMNRESPIRH